MSSSGRVLGLMALKEKARIAATLADLREVARQKAEAERMVERLTEALARQGQTGGVRLATEVLADHAMSTQILAEAQRYRDRQTVLAGQLAEEQARLAVQEHRHQTLTEKARDARRCEAEERQAARDAALPPRRR